MKRDRWPVENFGIRPAGKPDECFYCQEPIGGVHKQECVIRERTVVVELRMELVITKPEDWDADMIEYHLNDSSSCQTNIISQLAELVERLKDAGKCPCGLIEAIYLREATKEDEQQQKLFVADLPS
jgi:hypothetical protein